MRATAGATIPLGRQMGYAVDVGAAGARAIKSASDGSAAPRGAARARAASVSPVTASASRLTNGRALPPTTRDRLERSYRTRLDHVRVHTDAAATDLTHHAGADAATLGHHIAFAPGQYRPGTAGGDHLIAHEVGHVVQSGGHASPLRLRAAHSSPSDPAERDADAGADRFLRGEPAGISPGKFVTTRDRLMRRMRPGARSEPSPAPPARRRREPPAPRAAPTSDAAPGQERSGAGAVPAPSVAPAPVEPSTAPLEVPPAPAEATADVEEEAAAGEPTGAGVAGTETPGAEVTAPPGTAGAGPTVEPLMPPPPETLGPAARARLESAQAAANEAARAEAALPSAAENTSAAREAVTPPIEQLSAEANNAVVAALDERPPPSPEIEALCQRIYEAIRARRPPDEDSLVDADPEQAARAAGGELNSSIEGDTARVGGEYEQLQEGGEPPATEPGAQPEQPPATVATPEIAAAGAAPDPVPAEDVSLDADVDDSAARMQAAGMTSEPAQLVREGPIAEARDAQDELARTAARDPAQVLAEQQAAIASAHADMAALQAQALEALNGSRTATIAGSAAQQLDMTGSEEQTRANVGAEAQAIFADAQTRVRTLIEPLARTAMQRWEAGLPALSREFRAKLDFVKERIEERHSGVGGFFVGIADVVTGLPDWVVEAYDEAEAAFGDGVCDLVRDISRDVNAVIAAAEAIIADARRRIDELFAALPAELQAWAEEQRGQFAARLDGLAQEVQTARDDFNRDLAGRASGAVQEVREEIHALREAAGGLLGRIAAAIDAFLEDPVRFIINGLLSLVGIPPASFWRVVDRLGEVISGIADDPLGFANNLLEAVKQGFTRFFDNIGAHLLQGLLDWLFSGLGSVGVSLPADLSLKSVVTFFLQLMGLTWTNIRQILVRHIGEENVALLEQAYELISTLMAQGPVGIFELIKEQLDPARILETVMSAAIEFVTEALISRVAVRIIAMLNPAGAILTAIEAIYRVIRWIFENAARIFTLVETIVNGAWDLLNGNVGGMAGAIEAALARLIPPVIDFLASFIGLGDLPERIADVIRGLQQWVLGIVDRVVGFIAAQARRLLAALGLGGEGTEEEQESGDWWSVQQEFVDEGQPHTISVSKAGDHAEIMVESSPRSLRALIAEVTDVDIKRQLTEDLDAINGVIRAGAAEPPGAAAAAEHHAAQHLEIEQKVAHIILKLKQAGVLSSPGPTVVTWSTSQGRPTRITAEPLTEVAGNTQGSSSSSIVERELLGRWLQPNVYKTGRGDSRREVSNLNGIVHGTHVLHHDLHGPGDTEDWGIVNTEPSTNMRMKHIEGIAKAHQPEGHVRYTLLVTYHSDVPPPPEALTLTDVEQARAESWVGFYFGKSLAAEVSWGRKEGGGEGYAHSEPADLTSDLPPVRGAPVQTLDSRISEECAARARAAGRPGPLDMGSIREKLKVDNNRQSAALVRLSASGLLERRGNLYYVTARLVPELFTASR